MRELPTLSAVVASIAALLPSADLLQHREGERGQLSVVFSIPVRAQRDNQSTEAQRQRLVAILKPVVERFGIGEFVVELRPDDAHVVIIVEAKPDQKSRFWNAVTPKGFNPEDLRTIVSERKDHIVYLVPKTALRSERELHGAAEKNELPFLSPAYRAEGELQIPLGTLSVKLRDADGTKAAIAFARKNHLSVVEQKGTILRFKLTESTPFPTVFAAAAAMREQNVVQTCEPDFASVVQEKRHE